MKEDFSKFSYRVFEDSEFILLSVLGFSSFSSIDKFALRSI